MKRHEQLEQLVCEYGSLRALEMEAKNAKEHVGDMIKQIMSELDIQEYFADESTVRYKPQTQTSLNSKALKISYPEIFEEFKTEREIKVLRIA